MKKPLDSNFSPPKKLYLLAKKGLKKQTNKTTLAYKGDLWTHLFLSAQEKIKEQRGKLAEGLWSVRTLQLGWLGNAKILGWWVKHESGKYDYSNANNDSVLHTLSIRRETWTGTFSPCLSFPQCLDTKQDLLRVIWHKCCKKLASRVYLLKSFHCSTVWNAP